MGSEFWSGKRVLLTGHTGFKGAWLSLWLQRLGAEVTGFALAPEPPHPLFEEAGVATGMRSVIGDVRDLEALTRVMAEARPEIVLHLAAQALVREGYADPVTTFTSNVTGTVHVLEAVRHQLGVRAVVVVSSDKCYQNLERAEGYAEDDRLGGSDPYSASKACTEIAAHSYRQSFFKGDGVAMASARAGNVIGGGDWSRDRLIPDLVQAFRAGEPVLIRSPQAVRPWQFVLEPLHGYLMLAERLWQDGQRFAEGWNFGPPEEDAQPVEWIVEHMRSRWGEGASWTKDDGDHPPEHQALRLDCGKARRELGWRPVLTLADALDWVCEWYRGHGSGEGVRDLTEQQLVRYEGLLAGGGKGGEA